MSLPHLHGIVPPLPTPIRSDESLDEAALRRIVQHQLRAGVHGLWVLGTTARFDLVTESVQRRAAEVVAEEAAGRVPLVLNISEMGTRRTLERARTYDGLPYDYYAALPPWYQPMSPAEVADFYQALADNLTRPLVIYNAPWVCNQLSFEALRKLADHPRIVGTKDVSPILNRSIDWSPEERRRQDFSYLYGSDLIGFSTELGADGFVSALSNALPELAVALWDAARAGDAARAFRLQAQFTRLGRAMSFGSMHACLEVALRHRGLLERMLPAPVRSASPEIAARVVAVFEEVGVLPSGEPAGTGSSTPA